MNSRHRRIERICVKEHNDFINGKSSTYDGPIYFDPTSTEGRKLPRKKKKALKTAWITLERSIDTCPTHSRKP